MENIISCMEFQSIINGLNYNKTIMSYATNSVYINVYDNEDIEIGYFMLNPSWRIIKNNEIIQSSDVYPFHSRYKENEEDKESQDFYKWCSLTDSFRQERIETINVNRNGDIEFEWKNGEKLECCIFDYEEYAYYFYHIQEKMMYEVWFGKCIAEYYERKNHTKPTV
jgi:hypothetical protein